MSRLSRFLTAAKAAAVFPLHLRKACDIEVERYILDIMQVERKLDERRLIPYGYQVFSENDEDGIINEIFKRIGETNRFFVEFGAGNGRFSNSLYLLYKGWSGLWMECGAQNCEILRRNNRKFIDSGSLTLLRDFVRVENIEKLLATGRVPRSFDLLSVDIDGNDYHIWKSIEKYRPRVVVIEYNSKLRDSIEWVQPYDPESRWQGVNSFGASLKSLELLAESKGYALVGCNITGLNAFFVSKELVGGRFSNPFTSENHFQPPRIFLRRTVGLPMGFVPS